MFLIHFSRVAFHIETSHLICMCKSNDWFLYEMQHWTEMYQYLCRIKYKTKTTSLELKVFFRSNSTWFVQQQLIQRISIDPSHTTVLFVYTLKTTGGIIQNEISGMKVVTFFHQNFKW